MELVQVIGADCKIKEEQQIQEQPTYNFVGVVSDPLEPDHVNVGQQYIIFDDAVPAGNAGIILRVVNFNVSSQQNEDWYDNETPSHLLDHMYAKKPKEPGTERVKRPRRKLKMKELSRNQFFPQGQDTAPDVQEGAKINIIRSRQRRPERYSGASLPYRKPSKVLYIPRETPTSDSDPWWVDGPACC